MNYRDEKDIHDLLKKTAIKQSFLCLITLPKWYVVAFLN